MVNGAPPRAARAPKAAGRLAPALLLAAPLLFVAGELAAALAWRPQPYDWLRTYVSDLAVAEPTDALGRPIDSPLAMAVNAAIVAYALLLVTAVALLPHRRRMLPPAILSAAGYLGVAAVPYSASVAAAGLEWLHVVAAAAAIAGGVLVAAAAAMDALVGRDIRMLVPLGALATVGGVTGILFAVGRSWEYAATFERAAIYAALAAQLLIAVASLRRREAANREPGQSPPSPSPTPSSTPSPTPSSTPTPTPPPTPTPSPSPSSTPTPTPSSTRTPPSPPPAPSPPSPVE